VDQPVARLGKYPMTPHQATTYTQHEMEHKRIQTQDKYPVKALKPDILGVLFFIHFSDSSIEQINTTPQHHTTQSDQDHPAGLNSNMDSSEIYDQVREHYSSATRNTSVKYGEAVAKSFGYSADELANTPQDANLGLSCGNPLAIASLKEASLLSYILSVPTQPDTGPMHRAKQSSISAAAPASTSSSPPPKSAPPAAQSAST
jgi:hypothetical protein